MNTTKLYAFGCLLALAHGALADNASQLLADAQIAQTSAASTTLSTTTNRYLLQRLPVTATPLSIPTTAPAREESMPEASPKPDKPDKPASTPTRTPQATPKPAPKPTATPVPDPTVTLKPDEPKPTVTPAPKPKPKPKPKPVSHRLQGTLIHADETTLVTEKVREITDVFVAKGDTVTAGQTLVAFDCSVGKAALEEARLAHRAAKLKSRMARENFATGNLSASQLELAELDIDIALAKLNLKRREISRCRIVAPMDGIVTRIHTGRGATVGELAPLLSLASLASPLFELWPPIKWQAKLKPGAQFPVKFPALKNAVLATIKRVYHSAGGAKRVRVVAEIQAPKNKLKAGQTGVAELTRLVR